MFVVGDDVAFRLVVRDGDGVGDAVGFVVETELGLYLEMLLGLSLET